MLIAAETAEDPDEDFLRTVHRLVDIVCVSKTPQVDTLPVSPVHLVPGSLVVRFSQERRKILVAPQCYFFLHGLRLRLPSG